MAVRQEEEEEEEQGVRLDVNRGLGTISEHTSFAIVSCVFDRK